ncbi:hypothetical protein D3C81_1561670 [compost metagenome]
MQELLLTLLIAIQVAEHLAARIGDETQRFVAAVTAGRQVDTLAQADEVAFLEVEQRPFVHQSVQQAIFDQEELIARQFGAQVFGAFQADGLGARLQSREELARNALQVIDQLVRVSRLFSK